MAQQKFEAKDVKGEKRLDTQKYHYTVVYKDGIKNPDGNPVDDKIDAGYEIDKDNSGRKYDLMRIPRDLHEERVKADAKRTINTGLSRANRIGGVMQDDYSTTRGGLEAGE